MKILIIGNGIAGNQVAEQIRKKNKDHKILIVSAEKVPEYDPCSLPYFLGRDARKKDIFRKQPEDYVNHSINILYDNRVENIDPESKQIQTDKGIKIPYDKLVLAHGGSLFVPAIKGIRLPGVFSCKQLFETEKLNSHNGDRAVVIGSGAIGIEAAEALKKRGYTVYIIELLDWILPTLFDRPTAKRLEKALTSYGIKVCTGEKVLKILGTDTITGIETDKQTLPCDTVVVATGVVPGTALAQTAGIKTGRGILVNSRMETSVPDIYACGDCVETFDASTGETVMFQLKHNAIEQGVITAENILGNKIEYQGAYAFARAHFFNTHAATFGKTSTGCDTLSGKSEIIEKESGKDYLRVILMDGKIIGGQAIGKYADAIGLLIGAMWRNEDIHLLKQRWKSLITSAHMPHLLPQIQLGQLFGF